MPEFKPGQRLSPSELKEYLHSDEPKVVSRKPELLDAKGKPMNARKKRGANKAIMQQTLTMKLFQDGFIVRVGDVFHVDASKRLEDTYPESSIPNIRATLHQLVTGFMATGQEVTVNGYTAGKEATGGPETDRGEGWKDGYSGGVFSALRSGVCADGWTGNPTEARRDDSDSGGPDGEESGRVQEDDAGAEGE